MSTPAENLCSRRERGTISYMQIGKLAKGKNFLTPWVAPAHDALVWIWRGAAPSPFHGPLPYDSSHQERVMHASPQFAARGRVGSFRSRLSAFCRRWFQEPTALERSVDRKMAACRPSVHRPTARCAPRLIALESRQAPQLVLLSMMTAAAGGAALVAYAAEARRARSSR